MNKEQIKKLRNFEVEGSILKDENATTFISFIRNEDEFFTAEVFCRNFDEGPDGDEMNVLLEEVCESLLDETEIEIECFKNAEGNKIELTPEAWSELEKIILELC